MAEVLGAFAAASQCLEQITKVIQWARDFHKTFQEWPEEIERLDSEMEETKKIVELVKENSCLHYDLISKNMQECTGLVTNIMSIYDPLVDKSANSKHSTLGKICRTLKKMDTEAKTIKLLQELDRRKMDLLLFIHLHDNEFHGALLKSINLDIAIMSRNIDNVVQQMIVVQDTSTNALKLLAPIPTIATKIDVMLELFHGLLKSSRESAKQDEISAANFKRIHGGDWMVMFPQNRDYIERKGYTEQISTLLAVDKGRKRAALWGLGGVGKSQIALEYAYRTRESSPTVSIYWINASNAATFQQSYRNLAEMAKIPGYKDPKKKEGPLVKEWLQSKDSGLWLLIIDNADDLPLFYLEGDSDPFSGVPNDSADPVLLSHFFPESSTGCIILTTRNLKVAHRFAGLSAGLNGSIEVKKMDQQEAEQLLLSRSGLSRDSVTEKDCDELLNTLAFLPLAIAQAASYLFETPSCSLSDYVELLKGSESDIIEMLSEGFEPEGRYPEARHPVASTWLISFTQIQRLNPLAIEIFSFMAAVDRLHIPKMLLPTGTRPPHQTKAIGLLEDYSFITADRVNQVYDVHRLVHLAMRNYLRRQMKPGTTMHLLDVATSRALKILVDRFPEASKETQDVCKLQKSHARAVLDYDLPKEDLDRKLTLTHKVYRYHLRSGEYPKAIDISQRAVEWSQQAFGNGDKRTWCALDDLAFSLDRYGIYEKSIKLNRKVLAQRKSVLGEEHLDTLKNLNCLADVLRYDSQYDEAEKILSKVLAIREKVLGDNSKETLKTISSLAMVMENKGNFVEAKKLNQRAIEGRKALLGEDHEDTLFVMDNQSWVLYMLGHNEEAEALCRKTLLGRQRVLTDTHPDTLRSKAVLGVIIANRKTETRAEYLANLSEVVDLYRQVLVEEAKMLGSDHHDNIETKHNLAWYLFLRGDVSEAEKLMREVVEDAKRVLRKDHRDTQHFMAHLASILTAQEEPEKQQDAENIAQQAFEGCTGELAEGVLHKGTLAMFTIYEQILLSHKKLDTLHKTYRKFLDALHMELDTPDAKKSELELQVSLRFARLLNEECKFGEAEELASRVLEACRDLYPIGDPRTLEALDATATAARGQDRLEEALSLYQEEWKGYRMRRNSDNEGFDLCQQHLESIKEELSHRQSKNCTGEKTGIHAQNGSS